MAKGWFRRRKGKLVYYYYNANGDERSKVVGLGGEQPRSASQLVEDYIRPAAIAAGVIRVENGVMYDRYGEVVKRFGFHNLGRHSLAAFLMDEQENPAVVQAVMRHAKMDMTLYYSHSRRKAKRAAQEKVLQHLIPAEMRVPMRERETIQ